MAEEKKIGAIKEELQAAEDSMLPDFIARYEKDERSGVKSLVEKAGKWGLLKMFGYQIVSRAVTGWGKVTKSGTNNLKQRYITLIVIVLHTEERL